jgi:hypothetical protein
MEVKESLEKLIHRRFTDNKLNEELKKIDNTFTFTHASEEDMFSVEDYRLDISTAEGFGSIWYLPTRTNGMYITEVAYQVE